MSRHNPPANTIPVLIVVVIFILFMSHMMGLSPEHHSHNYGLIRN